VNLDDTIVAVASPPGRGGIGVVRLAGSGAKEIALPMLRNKSELAPSRAIFAELIDPIDSTRIDEVVVTYFAKPNSYTTDDIVEISAHGSPVVLRRIVEIALAAGARMAEPGEFTMRAFLNGRIDLTQAEAVRDLIESQTLYQARVAAQQLGGGISRQLKPIKQQLVDLIATLEAGIDFAEDDLAVMSSPEIARRVDDIRPQLSGIAGSFSYGKIVHEGLTLAIIGRPNVGKSSLFNRLVQRDRAIVTATPGTTRDLVTETVTIGDIPVRLVDTAGLREALDEAEGIGIQKSKEASADADLVLLVLDASQPQNLEDESLLHELGSKSAIVIENKSDITSSGKRSNAIYTSALTGDGIDRLREEILQKITGGSAPAAESGFLTSSRHHQLIEQSIAALDAANVAVGNHIPHEMLLLDLYSALRPLDEITGTTTNDDILNLIFSRFCIGK
jgi:tRNA modification GTPase